MAYKRSFPDWNENDDELIKGLVFLGRESKMWTKATPACRERAELLMKSGWKPTGGLVSDALSKPVKVYQEEFPY